MSLQIRRRLLSYGVSHCKPPTRGSISRLSPATLSATLSATNIASRATHLQRQALPSRARNISSKTKPKLLPRVFPTSGFKLIEADEPFQEEKSGECKIDHLYPVYPGEVFADRYQVSAKMGWGTTSTIWLARDLVTHEFVALKFLRNDYPLERAELPIYEHLNTLPLPDHEGAGAVRVLHGYFDLPGPRGTHRVLILQPTQMTADMFFHLVPLEAVSEDLVKVTIIQILQFLDYFHTVAGCVYTDVHPGNIHLEELDNTRFQLLEDDAINNPPPRKKIENGYIYDTVQNSPQVANFVMTDFGGAVVGPGPHNWAVGVREFNPPEVLLGLPWSYPIDIWMVGMTAWFLLEREYLFPGRNKDKVYTALTQLSQIVAAIGPMPKDLLEDKTKQRTMGPVDGWFKDEELPDIPYERTLESLETRLEDKTLFLNFMRRVLTWEAGLRPTAKELLGDPWLQMPESAYEPLPET